MRIVAAPGDLEGCGTYRILLPYRALRARGHDVTILTRVPDARLAHADVAVFQRQTSPQVLQIASECRARGIAVVHELDDNVHSLSPESPASQFYGAGKPATLMIERFLRQADALTVSTPELADAYYRFNPNVFVCRNALDDRHFAWLSSAAIGGGPKREGQIRIGWAGSFTHRADLRSIVPALVRIMREDERVRFVTIGDIFTQMFPEDLRWRVEPLYGTRTSPQLDPNAISDNLLGVLQYYDIALRAGFDIAIAPLEQTLFNRCKSDLKLQEYGAFGVPAVASRFGPYARYQAEARAEVVLLAEEPDEWEAALRGLVESPAQREELARANREHVRRHHLLSGRVECWEQALLEVAVERATSGNVWAPARITSRRAIRRRTGFSGAAVPPPLLVSSSPSLADTLCALPLIYRAALACEGQAKLRLMLARPEIAPLISSQVRSRIELLPLDPDVAELHAAAPEWLIAVDPRGAMRRYSRLLHAMQAHLVANDYPLESFALPRLRPNIDGSIPAYDFVVAPFCSDGADAQWPLERWQEIIDRLSRHFRVCVVDEARNGPIFRNADSFFGRGLPDLAGVIANARHGILSVNNAMSHLAHLLRARHLLIYPQDLPYCWQRNTNSNALHLVGVVPQIPVGAVAKAVDMLRSMPADAAA